MNTLQIGVITLIHSALTQRPYPLPEEFHIEDAASVIHNHQIASLCYEGAALCGIPTDTPFMKELFKTYCSVVIKITRQDRAVAKLFKAFEAAGIDYIPLKGCRMRALYPKPEFRLMGDADILIRLEQYESIVPIVKAQGYKRFNESDHDHAWESPDLFLELHHRLLSPSETAYTAIYDDGWSLAKHRRGSCWEMSLEDEWLYMICHFAKHYESGIGIRHVADLWMFLRTYNNLDNAYINKRLSELKFEKFYSNVLALIRLWFEDGKSTEITEFMTDYVFASGCWGTMDAKLESKLFRDTVDNVPRHVQFMKRLFHFFFPPRERLAWFFPVLRKHAWLYPFLALIRPFVRLIEDRHAPKLWLRIAGSYSSDTVDERIKQLEYVGLRVRR